MISLGVTALSGSGLDAGTYGVYDQQSGNYPNGNVAFVDWHTTNEGCADTTPPNTLGASGKVTVSRILSHYRDAFSPAASSPLVGAGDPADRAQGGG